MAVYLGLGSNLGRRRDNLRAALDALEAASILVERVSPVIESPALLPVDAPSDWNSLFLNLVAECNSPLGPDELLGAVKRIERQLGRTDDRHWAPRPIDIDILLFDNAVIRSESLTVPHAGLTERPFVLTPLAALRPDLVLPQRLQASGTDASGGATTALAAKRVLGRNIPLWMGIVNLTPDSFSDGGEADTWPAVETRIDRMIDSGVHILDFGAESTRPGAAPLTAAEEWSRLAPMLEHTMTKLSEDRLRPRISIDTYHASVARNALRLGVDIINDVSGLTQPEMLEIAADSNADFIAMHNLGLPADPGITLDTGRSAVDQVSEWLDRQLERWQRNGIDRNRVVFDPGIGFGKNPLQSLELLRGIDCFGEHGLRILVGHSRKSFMKGLAGDSVSHRDLVTIGSSLALGARQIDILRVHNVSDHVTAHRGWAHVQPQDRQP